MPLPNANTFHIVRWPAKPPSRQAAKPTGSYDTYMTIEMSEFQKLFKLARLRVLSDRLGTFQTRLISFMTSLYSRALYMSRGQGSSKLPIRGMLN